MTVFTVVCSVQIMQQVWAPEGVASELPCRAGVLSLIAALDRATESTASDAAGREGIVQFRQALEPEWGAAPTFRARCKNDPTAEKALGVALRLRYTAEDSLRLEKAELSRLRRKLGLLQRQLAQPPAP